MKDATSLHSLPPSTVALIYAGGYGKRLWPISTPQDPKQVNPVFTGKPMVKEALERAKKIFKKNDIFVVVTNNLFGKIYELLDLPKEQYIIQPDNADTAVAMGLAALYVDCLRPGAVAVTIYSDQSVANISLYAEAVKQGVLMARKHKSLVTVGTTPEYAATQFGYIKLGKKIGRNSYQSSCFIEKPSQKKADQLVQSKKYVWNTGLYIWEVSHILSLFKMYARDMYDALVDLRVEFMGPRFNYELESVYKSIRHDSFDRVISEKIHDLIVVVAKYHWSDIGTWKIVYDLAKKDQLGNVILGKKPKKYISVSSSNCLVMSVKKTVALVGVQNVCVIETGDTLLICTPDASTLVKEVAEKAGD